VIQVEGLSKIYDGGVVGVEGVSFELSKGQTIALIGPSGCGKTTTLRMLNRLSEPTSGSIWIDGQSILSQDRIAVRRRMGYVLQGGGLFPHWSAARNISLVPSLLQWEQDRIDARVTELLQLVDLDPDQFRDRYPADMSGGQRQRVGIARALAADPPIVLWDEPFSALDPVTRKQLQQEFVRCKEELGKTMVLVTHDLSEAFLLADQILVLREGHVQQLGTAEQLRNDPASDFVGEFIAEEST
jgi:osmoprotectant transport system ATP-binding protein